MPSRSGNLAETIVIVTILLLRNVNDNLFLRHFAMNVIVFELLPRGKEMTQKDLYTKNNRDIYKLYLIYLYLFTLIYTGISIHQQSKAKNSTKINLQILT